MKKRPIVVIPSRLIGQSMEGYPPPHKDEDDPDKEKKS